MNRLVCGGASFFDGVPGPASVRVPPAPSITPDALPSVQCVLMLPRPSPRKQWPYPRDPWDTSHLQVAHTPGEHKPRTQLRTRSDPFGVKTVAASAAGTLHPAAG